MAKCPKRDECKPIEDVLAELAAEVPTEALEKWIEEDMCDVPCAMPVDEAGEYMCRAAWYAAVKHTLAFVVEDLKKEAERRSKFPPAPSIECALEETLRTVAAFIETMKP